jgi:hypothetical protein
MPRGDGTGPNGMGPMTGRGLGVCPDANGVNNNNPQGNNVGNSRLGLGLRRGRGCRRADFRGNYFNRNGNGPTNQG